MKIAATSPSFFKNKKLQKEVYKYFPNAKLTRRKEIQSE